MTNNKQFDDAMNAAQKMGQDVQNNIIQATAAIQPELEKIQDSLQTNFRKAQESFTEIQNVVTQQPFNPVEVQKVVVSQQLELLKEYNRQVEKQLEQFNNQVSELLNNFSVNK